MSDLTLRNLRYLVAVPHSRHFGRAALACHVSQPTLSAQLKKLEAYLGVQLVERGTKRASLTAAGQRIVARARANSGHSSTNGPSVASLGGGMGGGESGNDGNLAFAAAEANTDVDTAHAIKLQHPEMLIAQGTMIAGILETSIQSDLPGMLRAIVSEDIYGFDGTELLIP